VRSRYNLVVASGPYVPIARGLLAALVVALVGAQFEAGFLDIFVWTIFATIEALWFKLRREAIVANRPPATSGRR
jgi:hypothetical protein